MKDWLDIHALADGCLEGEDRAAVEARIASEPTCRAEFSSIVFLKSLLRSKSQIHHSPASWSACRQRLVELQKRRRVEALVGKYAWGMTSIFFAAILGAAIMNRTMPRHDLETGDVARIVSGMAQLSQSHSQPEDMRSWIRSSPLTLDIRGMTPLLREAGGYKGHNVNRFAMTDGRGVFSLIVLDGDVLIEGAEPMTVPGNYCSVRLEGANGVTWSDRGYTIAVVGPRSIEELVKLAESVRLRQ